MSGFKVGAWLNPALLLIRVLVPLDWIFLWNPDGQIVDRRNRACRKWPGASRTNRRWQWLLLGPPGLRLKVLVDLGHILHHTLPVRPVCVQHLTELLQEKGRGHGGNATDCPFPTKGLRSRSRLVMPRNSPHCMEGAGNTEMVWMRLVKRKLFLPIYSGDTVPFKKILDVTPYPAHLLITRQH